MPRQDNIGIHGTLHHIITRAVERSKIFRNNEDREEFLRRFGKLVQHFLFFIYFP